MTGTAADTGPVVGRSGRRWWLVTTVAVVTGVWVGTALARVAQPPPHQQASSGSLPVAAAGTFDQGHG